MNNPAVRNGIILIVAVVIAVVLLSFLSTLLSAVVPIGITAIVAFILGRMSVNFNLLNFIRSARAAKPAASAEKVVEAPVKAAAVSKAAPAKAAEKPTPAAERLADEPKKESILLDPDFQIKTPEQIEAEARLLEQEATSKAANASADAVHAALEERRKRLLGGKE
jgi:uncharacterized membrane protein